MTSLALPNLMAIIAPFSFLIAALHMLNRLNTDSELIVLSASGSTVWTVARPLLLLLAFLVSLFLAFVSHLAQPWSMRLAARLYGAGPNRSLTQVIQPGRFSSPETNLMFHIRDRSADGGLLVWSCTIRATRRSRRVTSPSTETIVKQDGTAYLVMSAGHIIRRTDADEPPQIIAFDKYVVDLDRFEPQDDGLERIEAARALLERARQIPNPTAGFTETQPGQFRAELHERLVNPLYPIAFAFRHRSVRRAGALDPLEPAERTCRCLPDSQPLCRLAGLALNNAVARNPCYARRALRECLLGVDRFVVDRRSRARTGRRRDWPFSTELIDAISAAFDRGCKRACSCRAWEA